MLLVGKPWTSTSGGAAASPSSTWKICTSAASPLRGLHEKYLPLSRHASALFMSRLCRTGGAGGNHRRARWRHRRWAGSACGGCGAPSVAALGIEVVLRHPLEGCPVDLAGGRHRHLLQEDDLFRSPVSDPLACEHDEIRRRRSLVALLDHDVGAHGLSVDGMV